MHAYQARLNTLNRTFSPETNALLKRIETTSKCAFHTLTIECPSKTTKLELEYLGYKVRPAIGTLVHVVW